MNAIPKKLKEEMAADPYYKVCCVTGLRAPTVKIEWHHNFIFAGKQVQEKWCILPVSEAIHILARQSDTREKLDLIMLNRADPEVFVRFSRANLTQRHKYLKQKYAKSNS